MEASEHLPVFACANVPSSPPMTPGSHSHARFLQPDNHTPLRFKRMGAQSPPPEFIRPIGQGPQFHFTRPQSRGASSRPSTASVACATTPQDSEHDDASDEDSTYDQVPPFRRAEEGDINFILEYLDSDPGYDSDLEVVRPDQFEDAKSDRSGSRLRDSGIIDEIRGMHLEHEHDDSEDEEVKKRLYLKKMKRWSAGIYKVKRTYSMSVEGDSSYSDNDPLDDVDESARRLRRRVRGPGDRSSLIFEDKGFPNYNNIAEVEEPEDGRIVHTQGPPSIPSDDAFTLDDAFAFDELPFHHVEEWMEVESVS